MMIPHAARTRRRALRSAHFLGDAWHVLASVAGVLAFASTALAQSVTFYPGERIYAYDAESRRGLRTVMLQNAGIRNTSNVPLTLRTVDIELVDAERVIERRTLGAAEIARAAKNGAAVERDGLSEVLSFQFGGAQLLPIGTRFATDSVLAPGEAIIITSQVFIYRGTRSRLQLRVNGSPDATSIVIREDASQLVYQFPLRGQWYNGAGASLHSHHRWSPMEEFAFDLVRLEPDQATHRRQGRAFADYFAYGQPVFAAADGVVSSVIADQPEDSDTMQRAGETEAAWYERLGKAQQRRLAAGRFGILGNSVVIDHRNGEYSVYAHLRPGSVRVRSGARIARGQLLGQVGSSGNSTEPHLHFHLCDRPDPMRCAGIPVRFDSSGAPQTGDFLSRPRP